MPKCTECSNNCKNEPLVLLQAGHNLNFCSWECLIAYSVSRVRRRIARENRKMQRFLQKHVEFRNTQPRRAVRHRVN